MDLPPIVTPQEWDAARQELLVKEKELTRARDALAAQRRRMPRVAVQKDYLFDGPGGPASLLELFDRRRQLIVYRFFFQPDVDGWPDAGCPGCSMLADQVGHLAHLNARDTTLVFVSRAPQDAIAQLKKRMGWDVPWYTITDSFDADFGVDEWHGTNAFLRDGQRSSARTSSTTAATRRWAAPGHIWTSPLSAVRRSGRTRRTVSANAAVRSGGTGTTSIRPLVADSTLAGGSGSSARRLRRPERASDQNVERQHGQRRQQRHPRQLNRKRRGRQPRSGKPHGAKHCR